MKNHTRASRRFVALAAFVILGFASFTAATAGAASQPPIRVMINIALSGQSSLVWPENVAVAKIAVADINGHGGINGRKVKLDVCDDQNDPNRVTACSRQAVSNHEVAQAGSFTLFGDNIISVLQTAHIAYLGGCCPLSAKELTSPVAFYEDGGPMLTTGIGVLAATHCTNPIVVDLQTTFTAFTTAQINRGFKAYGKPNPPYIDLPTTASDFSAQAQQVSGHDCLVLTTNVAVGQSFLQAVQAAGLHPRIVGAAGNSLDQSIIDKFPQLTENGLLDDSYAPIGAPAWTAYKAAIAKYGDPKKYNYGALGTKGVWVAFQTFAQAARSIKGNVNNQTFLAAIKHFKPNSGGMAPPVDFAKPWTAVPALSRTFTKSVYTEIVKKGKIVLLSPKPVDIGAAYIKGGS